MDKKGPLISKRTARIGQGVIGLASLGLMSWFTLRTEKDKSFFVRKDKKYLAMCEEYVTLVLKHKTPSESSLSEEDVDRMLEMKKKVESKDKRYTILGRVTTGGKCWLTGIVSYGLCKGLDKISEPKDNKATKEESNG